MKAKRLVSFITATAFLLGSVAPGFAATTTTTTTTEATKAPLVVGKDVKGTKYEKPVAKLAALKVLNGKDSEGNVKPDDTITRAEFAKILVTELNMGNGISNSTTKYKDVPASHWASGYIALATGKGLIKGFPGGAFKPEAPVTYAEAATMVVRMLGYSPAVDEKAWPASYLSKAASIGVTDGVSVKANEAAKRGDVFVIAANALDTDIMEQDDYGTETIYRVKEGKTILSEEFDITIMDKKWAKDNDQDMLVVDKTPRVALSSLESNEIEFDGLAGTYEVDSSIDANAYLGQEVEAWIDEDDDIVYYLGASDDQEVYYDKVDGATGGKISLDAKDDSYDLLTGAYGTKIWANIEGDYTYGDTNWADADIAKYTDARVKVVLDSDDNVTAMVLTDYYPGGTTNNSDGDTKSGVIKQVKVADETIEYFSGPSGSTTNIDLDDADYAIVKDGVQAKLEDLKANDVINVMTDNSDKYYIVATSAKVEGKVEKVVTSDTGKIQKYDIYIGGKKYDVTKEATRSEDNNKSVKEMETTDIEDLDGETVTAYLDANGEVRHVTSGTVDGEKSAKVAIVTKGALYNPYDDSVTFEAVNEAGTELKWTFDASDVNLDNVEAPEENADSWEAKLNIDNGSGAFKPIIIEYDLDSAGKLSDVDIVTNDYHSPVTATPDEDDDTLTIGNSSYNVVEGTKIFDLVNKKFNVAKEATPGDPTNVTTAASIEDVKTTTWSSVESKNSLTSVMYQLDDDEVDYMFVLGASGSLGSDGLYGVVTGFSKVDGDASIVILKPDGEEVNLKKDSPDVAEYVYGRSTATISKGDFIRYETNSDNEIDNVTVIGAVGQLSEIYKLTPDLTSLDLDVATMVNVTDSTGTSVKGNVILDNGKVDGNGITNFTVNANTKYLKAYDTGKLGTATGVSTGDLVLIIDGDDDGRTADYVVIVKEDYVPVP